MADDENFDIDIYGDEVQDFGTEPTGNTNGNTAYSNEASNPIVQSQAETTATAGNGNGSADVGLDHSHSNAGLQQHDSHNNATEQGANEAQHIASTSASYGDEVSAPRQAPTQQGAQRRSDGQDDREVDPGATSALRLGELQWWTTEDDIRGWTNQCGVEDELKEITFNEHKVNGKSKGEAFLELASAQAATALKRHISTFGADQPYVKKHTVIYARPEFNPFKTNPKDAPARTTGAPRGGGYTNTNYSDRGGGGFRGGRGGYSRGGNNTMGGGYNNMGGNNAMSMGRGGGGYGGNNMMGGNGGYNNGGMGVGGFTGNSMMGGGGYNANFQNRGGMMGNNMRGGGGFRGGARGGFQNPMAMGGGMPNMGMNMMGMPNMMGMGNMGGNMGNNMGGNMGNMGGNMGNMGGGYVNPGFFQGANVNNNNNNGGSQSPINGPSNPHGVKRPRPE